MANSQGRLLKNKNNQLLKSVEIEEYSWMNFNIDGLIGTDNPRNSIILSRIHDPEELQTKISSPTEFNQKLGKKSKPITPVDLTHEYAASQIDIQMKKRRRMMDEDEAVDIELKNLKRMEKREEWHPNAEPPTDASTPTPVETSPPPPTPGLDANSFAPLVQPSHTQPPAPAETELSAPPQEGSPTDWEELRTQAWNESWAQGHEAGFAAGQEGGQAQGYADGIAQGEKAGFDAGWRDAEEKFALKSKAQKESDAQKIIAIVAELGRLREELIKGSEEVFIESLKLCAQKVTRAALKVDDKALSNLFLNLMHGLKGEVVVQVHPNDKARFQKMFTDENPPENLKITWKESPDIPEGDFRMDTGQKWISHSTTAQVEETIDSLIDELFEHRLHTKPSQAS